MDQGISAKDYTQFWISFGLLAALPLGITTWLALRALRSMARSLECLVVLLDVLAQDRGSLRSVKGGDASLGRATHGRLN